MLYVFGRSGFAPTVTMPPKLYTSMATLSTSSMLSRVPKEKPMFNLSWLAPRWLTLPFVPLANCKQYAQQLLPEDSTDTSRSRDMWRRLELRTTEPANEYTH